MERTTLDFNVGPGGWLMAVVRPGLGSAYVRLWRDEDGSWHPQGTVLLPGLNPEALRRIPVRRILLAVAASESLRDKLAARYDEEAPDTTSPDFMPAFNGYVVPEPPPVKIRRPAGRNLPDEFYATVGEAYRVAVERGEAPRTTIAESAGVSNEVAGRWVRQARKRGYLPSTEPGKVNA